MTHMSCFINNHHKPDHNNNEHDNDNEDEDEDEDEDKGDKGWETRAGMVVHVGN